MGSMQAVCSGCGKAFVVRREHLGRRATCTGCGKTFTVRAGEAGPYAVQDDDPIPFHGRSASTGCAQCGAEMDGGAVLCVRCGYDTRTGRRIQGAIGAGASPNGKPVAGYQDKASWSREPYEDRDVMSRRSLNAGLFGGLGMMVVAVVWFSLGYDAGRIFFYPFIMFVAGLISFIKGMFAK